MMEILNLKALAKVYVNGSDNGSADVLALLMENVAAKVWDMSHEHCPSTGCPNPYVESWMSDAERRYHQSDQFGR